ncbi:DUF6036 family nucleotidyltransferase [Ruminococcus sp.]|uniref:DUF6036 family nucleotidyltransferase n=1 Tax=Ruminococcus sp. TaxID=41978 RepID=UPI0025FA85AB|nr:DUF6036 family nucleotidyltransferase [Ruminococcus sp.]
MLSDDSKVFTKDNINLFFRDLSKEYKRLGGKNTPVEIILIGGAAIIESYGFREMTTDIDAVLPDVSIMKEAINRVGDMHDLPNGWLNADFMKTASWSPKLRQYSVASSGEDVCFFGRIVSSCGFLAHGMMPLSASPDTVSGVASEFFNSFFPKFVGFV